MLAAQLWETGSDSGFFDCGMSQVAPFQSTLNSVTLEAVLGLSAGLRQSRATMGFKSVAAFLQFPIWS